MKRLDHFLAAIGLTRTTRAKATVNRVAKATRRRHYAAAIVNRVNADWNPADVSADDAIRGNPELLRARARDLERNNDYARRHLSSRRNNVLGWKGMCLQMRVRFDDGRPNKRVNDMIEDAWKRWAKAENCSLNGEDSWREIEMLSLRAYDRDGGVLIRIIEGRGINEFGFALELLEIDWLDQSYTGNLTNGNRVYNGVERDGSNRRVAYWLYKSHPKDQLARGGYERVRVPAESIIHWFPKERIHQSVGVTTFISAMTRLHRLGSYEENELVQSDAASRKGGWFQNERGDEWAGPGVDEVDEDGNVTEHPASDFEPFSFDELPEGWKFTPYDPTHPVDAFSEFVKTTKEGIAAGLDTDYASMTGDLSKANYSSMRSGKLEVWEVWKTIQEDMIEKVHMRIFTRWLRAAIIDGPLDLLITNFDKWNKPLFRGRRWAWVDPSKDVEAAIKQIDAGLRSRAAVIAENTGEDLEDVYEQLRYEKELAEEMELSFAAKPATPQQPTEPKPDEEDEGEDEEDEEDAKKSLTQAKASFSRKSNGRRIATTNEPAQNGRVLARVNHHSAGD